MKQQDCERLVINMTTLQNFLSNCLFCAILGYCISWCYDKYKECHTKKPKILRCVWVKVLYDTKESLLVEAQFFASEDKYYSTYTLKVEAEIRVLKALERIGKNFQIQDILFLSKKQFQEEAKKRDATAIVKYKELKNE